MYLPNLLADIKYDWKKIGVALEVHNWVLGGLRRSNDEPLNIALAEPLFPVDSLCWRNHIKISLYFRQCIMSYQMNIGITVPIPVRYYMFEMCLTEDRYLEMLSAFIRCSFADSLEDFLRKRQCLKADVQFFSLEGGIFEVVQVCVLKNETGRYIVPLQVDEDTIPFIMTNDKEVLKGENAIY